MVHNEMESSIRSPANDHMVTNPIKIPKSPNVNNINESGVDVYENSEGSYNNAVASGIRFNTCDVPTDNSVNSSPNEEYYNNVQVPDSTEVPEGSIKELGPISNSNDKETHPQLSDTQYIDNDNVNKQTTATNNGPPEKNTQDKKVVALADFAATPENIAEFQTDKLLDMLSTLLDKIVLSNDRLHINTMDNTIDEHIDSTIIKPVSCFRGKHVPQISLEQYFQRIQKYCPITNDVFLSLLVYFDRISKKCNNINLEKENVISNDADESQNNVKQMKDENNSSIVKPQVFVMDSFNIHRLIITAVTVSTKFFSDLFYSNSRYARVGGISLQELNHLELQFLILCDFQLMISVEELQRYAGLLTKFWCNNNTGNDNNNGNETNNDRK
ncbi:hypothetical protein TPHA_0C01090 [Tetrapisispora phaffii CBS 4417]|uniref:Cyclin n=1 Tax=Tetrapisispora phaffii (strain ATCC 24235 / CBS 4417 / NBRC 1672 / NRRL Y-8282 / UCD 70-5) TaxID=1071381 RepID=G8BR89_TETPH|nr:hypothetical protein TPHA_0C01090 [Tetrapisispora phaffii CBS 4417]CCE62265.1 hypothetical protein TPHA_0C01090 [Tetrapisispora phaffii CBS 4417]